MTFVSNTPETFIARSDSKDAAKTCRGIVSNGRPCRRSLAALPNKTHQDIGTAYSNVPATSAVAATAALFCWQHKEQAESYMSRLYDRPNHSLQTRTSIDTLVSRLGICHVNDQSANYIAPKRNDKPTTAALDTAVPSTGSPLRRKSQQPRPAHRSKKVSFLSLLCCMNDGQDDSHEPIRRRRRTEVSELPSKWSEVSMTKSLPQYTSPNGNTVVMEAKHEAEGIYIPKPSAPGHSKQKSSTSNLLSLIPPSLPAPTAALLKSELCKPLSKHDDEGFIYMFWLTDSAVVKPSTSVARALLSTSFSHDIKMSDVSQQHSSKMNTPHPGRRRKILLKIGRASNVHRRLNQWSRQCNYDVSLVRFYPYIPSASLTSNPLPARQPFMFSANAAQSLTDEGVRKVPHVHRVERLIHIELSEHMASRSKCATCGRVHKEWFEVDASMNDLRHVDQVIRRWVAWAEGKFTA